MAVSSSTLSQRCIARSSSRMLATLSSMARTVTGFESGRVATSGVVVGGGDGSDVGGEEDELEVFEGGFVDFAGEGDDGADGLGEGLAGARDRLLHAVED